MSSRQTTPTGQQTSSGFFVVGGPAIETMGDIPGRRAPGLPVVSLISDRDVPVVMGVIRLPFSRRFQLCILASGTVVFAIAFSALQEWVFRVPDFRYGGWMTFLMYVTYFCCAAVERYALGDTGHRRGQLKDYGKVAAMAMSGVYLTNWAVGYISYATRMVFKSSKVLPVMLVGAFMQHKRYAWQEYSGALLLASGLSIFAQGDASDSSIPHFSLFGIALITAAVLADAVTANFEEKNFFRIANPASQGEVMYYLSAFSAIGSAVLTILTGELLPAVTHSLTHPAVVPMTALFSTLGYLSVSFVLMLIKHFDATMSEIVKSMRKVLQVAVSFLLYAKPLDQHYVVGGVTVVVALWWLQRTERAREAGLVVRTTR